MKYNKIKPSIIIMSTKKVVKRKISIVRSFRLLDFHVYDQSEKREDSDSGSDEERKYSNVDNNMFVIQMFGIDEKGKTCSKVVIFHFNPAMNLIGYYSDGIVRVSTA